MCIVTTRNYGNYTCVTGRGPSVFWPVVFPRVVVNGELAEPITVWVDSELTAMSSFHSTRLAHEAGDWGPRSADQAPGNCQWKEDA